jgi:hypothetical protein
VATELDDEKPPLDGIEVPDLAMGARLGLWQTLRQGRFAAWTFLGPDVDNLVGFGRVVAVGPLVALLGTTLALVGRRLARIAACALGFVVFPRLAVGLLGMPEPLTVGWPIRRGGSEEFAEFISARTRSDSTRVSSSANLQRNWAFSARSAAASAAANWRPCSTPAS